MKKSLPSWLFLIGTVFLLFAGVQIAEYGAESRPEPDHATLYYSECRIAEFSSPCCRFSYWLLRGVVAHALSENQKSRMPNPRIERHHSSK